MAYDEAYLSDVVENQGKLFDFIAHNFPDKDTAGFINSYMKSNTRKSMDEAQAYVLTMDFDNLWRYYSETEGAALLPGRALDGFLPDWIGEFYAYYQWYYDVPSAQAVEAVPVEFLINAYPGLHDLDLDLAVKKVGAPNPSKS